MPAPEVARGSALEMFFSKLAPCGRSELVDEARISEFGQASIPITRRSSLSPSTAAVR